MNGDKLFAREPRGSAYLELREERLQPGEDLSISAGGAWIEPD
jgi:hypothetical protein